MDRWLNAVCTGCRSATRTHTRLPSAQFLFGCTRSPLRWIHSSAVRSQCHYAVLGCKPEHSPKDIKIAYYKLAKLYHPDTHQEKPGGLTKEEAKKKFAAIGEAYEVLSDAEKRRAYDAERTRARHPGFNAQYSDFMREDWSSDDEEELSSRRARRMGVSLEEWLFARDFEWVSF